MSEIPYRARVVVDAGAPIENVRVFIAEHAPAHRPKSWEGRCLLPYGGPTIPGVLRLTLEDGRSGTALVRSAVVGTGRDGWAITFQGSGPLE